MKVDKEDIVEAMIISDKGVISLMIKGDSYTANPSHINYDLIKDKIKSKNHVGLLNLIDVGASIKKASKGKIAVIDGSVFYNGKEVINPMSERIIKFVKDGLPFEPMVKFLENLLSNPSRNAVQELYLFLENNMLPITPDGHFLAYKKVSGDYKDIHSGTFDNSVGKVCEMPRNEVCDDRDTTCSSGLHFCSKEYLPSFGNCSDSRVVIVKINPADVVSIPSDYNNAKGRTARYEVVGDCTDEYNSHFEKSSDVEDFEHLEKNGIAGGGGDDEDYKDNDDCGYCSNCGELGALDDSDLCADCEPDKDEVDPADNDDDVVIGVHPVFKSQVGRKPNGQNFHNKRDKGGRFTKK